LPQGEDIIMRRTLGTGLVLFALAGCAQSPRTGTVAEVDPATARVVLREATPRELRALKEARRDLARSEVQLRIANEQLHRGTQLTRQAEAMSREALRLEAEAARLRLEGERLRVEGDALSAGGVKLRAEGERLKERCRQVAAAKSDEVCVWTEGSGRIEVQRNGRVRISSGS
jgi:hypothetical protein